MTWCDTNYTCYPHYELSLIDPLDRGRAWVCHNIERAIYPERHAKVQKRSRNSPQGNCPVKSSAITTARRNSREERS